VPLEAAAVEERAERARKGADDRDRVELKKDVGDAAAGRDRVRQLRRNGRNWVVVQNSESPIVWILVPVASRSNINTIKLPTRSTTNVTTRIAASRSRRCRWVGVSARRTAPIPPRARLIGSIAMTSSR
jgi:hypothetical protein